MTTSFGSVCLGALVVAVVQTVRDVLRLFSRRRRGDDGHGRRGTELAAVVGACADCLLDALERLLKYANRYALSYVAAYGMSFTAGSRKVYALFADRGWEVRAARLDARRRRGALLMRTRTHARICICTHSRARSLVRALARLRRPW